MVLGGLGGFEVLVFLQKTKTSKTSFWCNGKMLKYHNIYLMSCLRWWAKKHLPTLPDFEKMMARAKQ
jgi:hypothetical protein